MSDLIWRIKGILNDLILDLSNWFEDKLKIRLPW